MIFLTGKRGPAVLLGDAYPFRPPAGVVRDYLFDVSGVARAAHGKDHYVSTTYIPDRRIAWPPGGISHGLASDPFLDVVGAISAAFEPGTWIGGLPRRLLLFQLLLRKFTLLILCALPVELLLQLLFALLGLLPLLLPALLLLDALLLLLLRLLLFALASLLGALLGLLLSSQPIQFGGLPGLLPPLFLQRLLLLSLLRLLRLGRFPRLLLPPILLLSLLKVLITILALLLIADLTARTCSEASE